MKVIEKKDLCVWLVLCQLHRTPSVFNSFLGLDCFFFCPSFRGLFLGNAFSVFWWSTSFFVGDIFFDFRG